MKHYTKSELKIVRDMSLPNQEAATLLTEVNKLSTVKD